jgi:hypothetical protein
MTISKCPYSGHIYYQKSLYTACNTTLVDRECETGDSRQGSAGDRAGYSRFHDPSRQDSTKKSRL